MIKKHSLTIITSIVSVILGVCGMYVFGETRVEKHTEKVTAGILLEETVSSHTRKFTMNDEKWERDIVHEEAQEKRIDGTEKMQVALQRDQAALLTGQSQIREQQIHDLEFKVDIVRELGELSGHIKSITNIKEVR